MKKIFALLLALCCMVSLAACSQNTDNLPALSSITEMEEATVNELLKGYHRDQLIEVWGEPTNSSDNEDIWIIDDITLTVNTNNKDKVVVCGLNKDTTDKVENADTAKADYDLSSNDAMQVTDTVEKEDVFIVPQSFRTNSTEITVENKSGVDIDVFLYLENDLNNPIQQMTVSNEKTNSFANLTSSVVYHVGLSADTSTQLDVSITD